MDEKRHLPSSPQAANEQDKDRTIQELERRLDEANANLQALILKQIDAVLERGSTTPLLLHQAQAALRRSNEELERKVAERTGELEQEIKQRKQVEENLRRRVVDFQQLTRKLEQSNKALEDFAFVASHDLNEPLRKINNFGEELEKLAAEKLNEEERDFLNRMRRASQHMMEMLEGLLTYSRVTTHAKAHRPVNMTQTVKEVVSDLEIRITQSNATVEIRELPTIEAEPTQMHQLMLNLIGNALKFRRPDASPVVRVWSERLGEQVQIFIQDNGIGFDESQMDRVFEPFKRLHSRSEFEGHGMGMAICQKIIDRHGGEITAHSKPGEGSTFMITLPVKTQAENTKRY